MSRFHPEWDLNPLFDAASHWKSHALESEGAVFGGDAIWSDANLASLTTQYAENLDEGEGDFLSKLKKQLAPADPDVKQLAAEMLWFMLLCPSNIGAEKKRDTVYTIWDWSERPRPPASPWLTDDVLVGVGSAGIGFSTYRPFELIFLIEFMKHFRASSPKTRAAILADGWSMAEWIEEVPKADSRQLRHMILYLLFPDCFERIFGRSDRAKLIRAFTGATAKQTRAMSALEMSKAIQEIRAEQESKYGKKELDFYWPPLKEIWKPPNGNGGGTDKSPTAFDRRVRDVGRDHVIQAIEYLDMDGFPPDAASSTYDLIYVSGRYPPKYVLSKAVEVAKGEEFPRTYSMAEKTPRRSSF